MTYGLQTYQVSCRSFTYEEEEEKEAEDDELEVLLMTLTSDTGIHFR